MIEYIDIVLGCSYGDEGKGKVTYHLLNTENYDLCIRFNGSGNAGHTIYKNDKKVVIHQLPIGIMKEDVYNLISSDCLINISKLHEELEMVRSLGIQTNGRLFISEACHIITPDAIEYDTQNNLIGTTGSGIGPTYSKKMLRTGVRAIDYRKELEKMGIILVNMRKFWKKPPVNVTCILLEGAQGFELDINWTNHYPYCTSSTCTLAGAINTGIPIQQIRHIYGISKIYDTYVGTRDFTPINYKDELNLIGELGAEYGATTGRKRQCNFLNLDNLEEALRINHCNICIINKTDILSEAHIFRLYHNGNLISFESLQHMQDYITNALHFIKVVFSSSPHHI